MRDIKFEYIYSDGLNRIRKIFTLDEISNGDCYDVVLDSPLLARFVIVSKRQYIGKEDINGKEIFEGDKVKHLEGINYIEYDEDSAMFVLDCYSGKPLHHNEPFEVIE